MTATGAGGSADGLQAAFERLRGSLRSGDLEAFYACLDPRVVIYDEDIPFRLDKSAFADHIGFHVHDTWQSFEWYPRDVRFRTSGDTGFVAGYCTFRGKPRDAGFRQRHMTFSQGWVLSGGQWRMLVWHQSPLDGHILESSPG